MSGEKTCPLGEDCDLTIAWMAGAANARDQMKARIEQLEFQINMARADADAQRERASQAEAAIASMFDCQPIETAPRDGTPFFTFSAHAANDPREGVLGLKSTPILVMAWLRSDKEPSPVDEHGNWHDFHCYEPTHWMPMDAAIRAALSKKDT